MSSKPSKPALMPVMPSKAAENGGSDLTGELHQLTDFKQPQDIIGLIKHERIRWLVSTIALGETTTAGDQRPVWAVRAASEFWKCCQDFPRTKQARSENYQIGFMLGVINRLPMPEALAAEPELMNVASPEKLLDLLQAEFANAPAADAAEFYAGFSEGLKRGQLTPRAPFLIYLVFAVAWPEITTLKNVGQVHAWLDANLGANMTGTRDRIAKICQKVRMPLTDKGGRPRQEPRKAPKS